MPAAYATSGRRRCGCAICLGRQGGFDELRQLVRSGSVRALVASWHAVGHVRGYEAADVVALRQSDVSVRASDLDVE
eukprot:6188853-Pleurochrysis_carterae.AAC.1